MRKSISSLWLFGCLALLPTGARAGDDFGGAVQSVYGERTIKDDLIDSAVFLANYAGQKAALSADIMAARKAFWASTPDSPNRDALATAYAQALNRKAMHYLEVQIGRQVMSGGRFDSPAERMMTMLERGTGEVDGDYDDSIESKFNGWTFAVGIIPNPDPAYDTNGVARAAIARAAPQWQAFCAAEMKHEFLIFSPASPAFSKEPATRFIAAAVEHGGCETFDDARALYQRLTALLGTAVVDTATDITLKPKANGLSDALSTAASGATDDRTYGLYLLQGSTGDSESQWKYATAEWSRLTQAAGEAKTRAAVALLRSTAMSRPLASRRLYSSLSVEPPVDADRAKMFPMYQFADLGGAPWNCLAVGSNGDLFGLRVSGPLPPQVACHRGEFAQRSATVPWFANSKAATGGPTVADKSDTRVTTEVVRVRSRTGSIEVLATLTSESIARHGGGLAPMPGSLLVRDGWVYGTDAAAGVGFRMHEDGSAFTLMGLPHRPGEIPVFWGFDRAGHVLGSTPHSVFVLSADARGGHVLTSDPANWVCPGTVAPDGTIYFIKYFAKHAFKEPAEQLMAIEPSGDKVRQTEGALAFGVSLNPAVTVIGQTTVAGFTGTNRMAVYDGKTWTTHPSDIQRAIPPMVLCDGCLFVAEFNYSEYEPDTLKEGLGALSAIAPDSFSTRKLFEGAAENFAPTTGVFKLDDSVVVGVTRTGGKGNQGYIYAIDVPAAKDELSGREAALRGARRRPG